MNSCYFHFGAFVLPDRSLSSTLTCRVMKSEGPKIVWMNNRREIWHFNMKRKKEEKVFWTSLCRVEIFGISFNNPGNKFSSCGSMNHVSSLIGCSSESLEICWSVWSLHCHSCADAALCWSTEHPNSQKTKYSIVTLVIWTFSKQFIMRQVSKMSVKFNAKTFTFIYAFKLHYLIKNLLSSTTFSQQRVDVLCSFVRSLFPKKCGGQNTQNCWKIEWSLV